MTHWAQTFVGKPWIQHARGPEAFDCWGLLIWIYRERYGVELPDVPGASLKDFWRLINAAIQRKDEWTEVETPFEGAAVAIGGTELYHHVGLYLNVDGGLILHACNMKKIRAQTSAAIRAEGLGRISYFKHHGAHY